MQLPGLHLSATVAIILSPEIVGGTTNWGVAKAALVDFVFEGHVHSGKYRSTGKCDKIPDIGEFEMEIMTKEEGHQAARLTARTINGTVFSSMQGAVPLAWYHSGVTPRKLHIGHTTTTALRNSGCFRFYEGVESSGLSIIYADWFVRAIYASQKLGDPGPAPHRQLFFCQKPETKDLVLLMFPERVKSRTKRARCGFPMIPAVGDGQSPSQTVSNGGQSSSSKRGSFDAHQGTAKKQRLDTE
ncbi:hypothetical protein FOZ63_007113 [Perkinsus olseni]|uniref:Uncharacterized protein n=1 Tax=Perkinsus olseni TaxID=32597 RepID=A0A7J6SVA0_PEROL|nr:hypothetical protein FOZ63_007113 [Perkinsus olseni]KAF4736751.1 hypothetical protein FOZ62_021641 [Perkinsus olseni]